VCGGRVRKFVGKLEWDFENTALEMKIEGSSNLKKEIHY
jgi:hypothetical protein